MQIAKSSSHSSVHFTTSRMRWPLCEAPLLRPVARYSPARERERETREREREREREKESREDRVWWEKLRGLYGLFARLCVKYNVCLCVCACASIHFYACTCVCIYIRTHAHIHARTHQHLHTHTGDHSICEFGHIKRGCRSLLPVFLGGGLCVCVCAWTPVWISCMFVYI